jgi:hypothetical protein
MNVSGPGNAIPSAYRLPPVARPEPQPTVEVGRKPAAAIAPSNGAATGIDAPPPGSDPALWSVLTTEERRFFAQQAALGPIHYGPGSTPQAPAAPLGARIDVRG